MTPKSQNRKSKAADSAVGDLVRKKRRELHLSQAAVAEQLDISAQQLAKYESGTNRIPASRIVDLADILGVSPAYFFKWYVLGEGSHETAAELKLLSHFLRIKKEEDRQLVLDLAKRLGTAPALTRTG